MPSAVRRKGRLSGNRFLCNRGVEKRPRNCWVEWEEEDRSYPNLVIELMSDSTARVDRGLEKELYQDRFHTPEYFWFSPHTLEFKGFRLQGKKYVPINPLENGWRWSQQLGLYLAIVERKLRYVTQDGELVPAPEKSALQERRAHEAETRNRILGQKLRELGIYPNSL